MGIMYLIMGNAGFNIINRSILNSRILIVRTPPPYFRKLPYHDSRTQARLRVPEPIGSVAEPSVAAPGAQSCTGRAPKQDPKP